MVCPMRFVLVGVSAVVALCVAFWALQEHEEIVGGEGKGDPRKRSKCGRDNNRARDPRGWLMVLFDMFTGRYLWNLVYSKDGHTGDAIVEDSPSQRSKKGLRAH